MRAGSGDGGGRGSAPTVSACPVAFIGVSPQHTRVATCWAAGAHACAQLPCCLNACLFYLGLIALTLSLALRSSFRCMPYIWSNPSICPYAPLMLQVLDVSRNNLHYLPPWLPRRLAPSLAVLRLHTNRLEALPSDIRTMTALQVGAYVCAKVAWVRGPVRFLLEHAVCG